MNASPTPSAPPKRENLLLNLICNVAVPTIILAKFSSEQWFGPKWSLLIALAFPIAYGTQDFIRRRRFNFVSIIGFVSVLITGGFGLMQLDGLWFALKEGAIPAIIGLAVLGSMRAKLPLVQEFLYNPQLMNVPRIDAALETRGTRSDFQRLLRSASYLLALAFFVSSGLNYALARYLLKSPSGTEAFNGELAKMNLWSWPVIVVPSMAMMMFALWRFLKGLEIATGLKFEDLMHDNAAGKKPAASEAPASDQTDAK